MAVTLFLKQTRAKFDYRCTGCDGEIKKGFPHYRHDPHPYERAFRGGTASHWCVECVNAAPTQVDEKHGRLKVRVTDIPRPQLIEPIRIEVIPIGEYLLQQLAQDWSQLQLLKPEQFELLICDRLYAMGFEPQRTGHTNRKDGGIDILFWPRSKSQFPFLGVAQIKHHAKETRKEGPESVRQLAGVIQGQPFNAALLVTNTGFTPDAEWFAKERAKLIRLRGLQDVKRWVMGKFEHADEWREIPKEIELCPGIVIPTGR